MAIHPGPASCGVGSRPAADNAATFDFRGFTHMRRTAEREPNLHRAPADRGEANGCDAQSDPG